MYATGELKDFTLEITVSGKDIMKYTPAPYRRTVPRNETSPNHRIPYSKYVLASHYHNSSCAHYDTFDDNKYNHVYMDKEYLRE